MQRPNIKDERVCSETAEALLPKVVAWLKRRGVQHATVTSDRLDEIRIGMTKELLKHDSTHDLCESASGAAWLFSVKSDDDLRKSLGTILHKKREVHHRLVKTWARDNVLMPKHRVGENVRFKHLGKVEHGEITKVEDETAQYVVFCEHLGHVKKGLGSYGFYVNYEDIVEK